MLSTRISLGTERDVWGGRVPAEGETKGRGGNQSPPDTEVPGLRVSHTPIDHLIDLGGPRFPDTHEWNAIPLP